MHAAALVFMLLLPSQVAAESPPAAKPLTGWQALFQEHAIDWEIARTDAATKRFMVVKHPLAFWSQPVRGGATGAVYLWREESGRPAVIGTLFIWPHPSGSQGVAHELQSLATEPIRGNWRDSAKWTVSKAGVKWKALPNAPPPSDSPSRRLLQLRTLAKQFEAVSYDREDKLWDLRLIGRPVHRYDMANGTNVVDGAIFSFVQGTDSEAFLLIEAIRRDDALVWQYTLAPMTDFRLEVKHAGEVVWKAGYRGYDSWDQPYVASTVEVRDTPDGEARED